MYPSAAPTLTELAASRSNKSVVEIVEHEVEVAEAEVQLCRPAIDDNEWVRAALGLPSPRDLPAPPVVAARTRVALQIRRDEEAAAYKAAIASSLDTVLPSTPANSKRRAKRRPPTTPKASNFLPTVDAAGHHSPSASRAYKEGAQLAEAGMDFEASRRFLNGLSHAPDSIRLRAAFERTLDRARCSCRPTAGWARPCPEKRAQEGKPGFVSDYIRGVTWSYCPCAPPAPHPPASYISYSPYTW